jgi:t-SNARE complex subunit (syntaxin)
MTLLTLRKVWIWIKNYWYIPVIVVLIIAALIIWRKVPDSLSEIIRKSNEMHRKEVDTLNEIHAEEIDKREKALEKYHKTIEQVEREYERDRKKLDRRKKAEIKKTIEKYQDDPVELTKRLSDITGFEVV